MPANSEKTRPEIWSEGSQKPPFEPRAFAKAALKIGRETVSGILARCGTSAEGVGGELRAGRIRIPAERLGRVGRYLPSAETTSRAVFSSADILRRAARVANPPAETYAAPPVQIDSAYRDLFRDGSAGVAAGNPSPVKLSPVHHGPRPDHAAQRPEPGASHRAKAGDHDELASIRAFMMSPGGEEEKANRQGRRVAPAAPVAQAKVDPQKTQVTASQQVKNWVKEGAARVLGYWMIAFIIPYGALRAGMAHLNGEDLRKADRSE